jgi:aryl-alcohol dehydrogenase-like predicted oxidoreductase
MERLIREGKVLAWGAIVEAPGEAAAVVAEPAFATVQVELHALDRAATPLLAAAAERKTGVLVRRPLAGGALDRLASLVDRDEVADAAELALRWLLAQPIAAALVGARSREHLDRNLAAADGRPLTPRLRARLDDLEES